LGGETSYEGKICRSCLGKKQRGEVPAPKQPKEKISQEPTSYQEEVYRKPYERDSREKRILSRELGRKQRKKSSYLTQFILNLAVGQ
jgi:hypothetical protein